MTADFLLLPRSFGCPDTTACIATVKMLSGSGRKTPVKGATLLQTPQEGHLDVIAKFPKPGRYHLELYARPAAIQGPYDWAATYAVRVAERGAQPDGFPTIYSPWGRARGVLVAPLGGVLPAGQDAAVAVRFVSAACAHGSAGRARHESCRRWVWPDRWAWGARGDRRRRC